MERELILTTTEKTKNRKKINAEIEHIKKILPYIESFEAFCSSSEVLDLSKETMIKKKKRLFEIYEKGLEKNVFMFVFNKN